MPAQDPLYLDLDRVEEEARVIVIRLAGVEHAINPISTADWIANTKILQDLNAAGGDTEKEVKLMMAMITRSFKTLTEDVLMGMPVHKLTKILEFARAHNGEETMQKNVATEAAAAPANPPAAA